MNKIKETRGGKRAGSGRPKREIPSVPIGFKVEPEIYHKFLSLCLQNGRSMSKEFSAMVKKARLNKPKD